jgi:hypothetical protein
MRRAMRVSTVFVGTAAMAAGFGPSARAMQASHITTISNCDHNKTWAEVSIKSDPFNHRSCWEFGFKGETHVSLLDLGNIDHLGQCGGNNYGGFPWYSNGREGFLAFGPGTYFRDITGFRSRIAQAGNSIKISGWTGGDKCP